MEEELEIRYVFMSFLALCNEEGIIDMTYEAIARRINLSQEKVVKAITKLSEPDPQSRSDINDGRRLSHLDSHRDWGWQIVNFKYYNAIRNLQKKREADRVRIAEKRSKIKDSRKVSLDVAKVAYITTDITTDITTVKALVQKEPCTNAFDLFWKHYPKREDKKKAQKAFSRINPDKDLLEKMIQVIEGKKASQQWMDKQYIPLPTSWLNGHRWEDEETVIVDAAAQWLAEQKAKEVV